jgi:hypothetical protein
VLPIVLLTVLLTAILPAQQWVLHTAAVVVGGFTVAALFVAQKSLLAAALALALAALWFTYYALSLRAITSSRTRA